MTRPVSIARTVFIAALTATALGPVPSSEAAAGRGTWVQQAPKGAPATAPQLTEIHCPSAAVCYALGTTASSNPSRIGATHLVIERTVDGGVTWSSQTLQVGPPIGFPGLPQLACPSTDSCYLLSGLATPPSPPTPPSFYGEILVTVNGGQSWRVAYKATGIELGQVVCPDSADCDVSVFHEGPNISEALLTTRDGGQTWSSSVIPVTHQPLFALNCPTISDCYLSGLLTTKGSTPPGTGGIAATHDGGKTWATADVPSGQYSSIACPSAEHCYLLLFHQKGGADALVTKNGGQSWATLPISTGPYGPGGQIVCVSDSDCYALWAGVWRTVDAGATWHSVTAVGPQPSYASCPSTTTCYGVGFQGVILKTTDGVSWKEPTPYTRLGLTSIVCPSASACYAVGSGILLTTSNGGATWVRQFTGTDAYPFSVACPDLHICLVTAGTYTPTGTKAVLLRTVNGGQTWSVERGKAAFGITCPSRTVCYAAGASGARSSFPPTSTVWRSTDAGRTWTTQSTLPKGYALNQLACPTATACIGVGGLSPCIDDVARVSARVQDSKAAAMRPALGQCQESGWLFSTVDSGRHWVRQFHRTEPPYVTEGADVVTASCVTSSVCYAAGYGIWLRSTFNGRAWKVKVDGVTPTNFVTSLSCGAPNTCWGIGMELNSLGGVPVRTTNGGNSWQVIARGVPPPGPYPESGGLNALDCPTTSRCFGVGNSGLIMAYSP